MAFMDECIIISNKPIAEGIFELIVLHKEAANAALAGQFANIYLKRADLLLPRPISICGADSDTGLLRFVYAVVGKGTEEMAKLSAGDTVRVLAPLGNTFLADDADMPKKPVLIGGGVGVPPLLFLAQQLTNARAFLGFRHEPFLVADFAAKSKVQISTDDGAVGFHGNPLQLMNLHNVDTDMIFACGPMPMLRAVAMYAKENNIRCRVSMEQRMACGYGACVGCAVSVGGVYKKACKDGPVFWADEVDF